MYLLCKVDMCEVNIRKFVIMVHIKYFVQASKSVKYEIWSLIFSIPLKVELIIIQDFTAWYHSGLHNYYSVQNSTFQKRSMDSANGSMLFPELLWSKGRLKANYKVCRKIFFLYIPYMFYYLHSFSWMQL